MTNTGIAFAVGADFSPTPVLRNHGRMMPRRLFAIDIDQVSVVLPTRVGATALLDDALTRDPAAQIGDATLALFVCGRQPGWRPGIHGLRLGWLVRVMLACPVSALAPGTGSTIEPVTRPATASGGIPSRIGLEYSFWRNT